MSDVLERLSGADPYAGNSFELSDVARFITRVSMTPPGASTWRRFQLGVSGAVSATTLIMLSAIAALQGAAPSLPVLNFAAASSTHANDYASAKTSTTFLPKTSVRDTVTQSAVPTTQYHFIAAPSFSNAAAVGPAYPLRVPSNPKTEITRIASIFGVSGELRSLTPATAWQVRGRGAKVALASQDLWTWSYVKTSTSGSDSIIETVPVRQLTLRATQLVSGLGYGYQLGTPTVTTGSARGSEPANTAQGFVSIHLRFPVVVSGTTTGLVSDFAFSTTGALLSAHGPAFFVASSYPYPLITPVAGVAALNTERASLSHRAALGRSSSDTTGISGAIAIPLSATSLTLGAYRMSDGALWLVPMYRFSSIVEGRTFTWPILALDPRFTKNATLATPLNAPALKS